MNRKKLKYCFIPLAVIVSFMTFFLVTAAMTDTLEMTLNNIEASQWQKLSKKKIFFCYRSFGRNIIEGIQDLGRENPHIRFEFLTPEDPINIADGFFLYHWVDMNESPQSLSEGYVRYINKMMPGKEFDIVMIRFTPFYGKRDVEEILANYAKVLGNLKKEFPDTIFVHATFPLTHVKETWRTWIKKLIKKEEIWEYGNNILINEYNRRLREVYKGKEAFFDIASIQSTSNNGKRSTFMQDGKIYYHMASEYTYDGTHLNEKGRRIVAERLLVFFCLLIDGKNYDPGRFCL